MTIPGTLVGRTQWLQTHCFAQEFLGILAWPGLAFSPTSSIQRTLAGKQGEKQLAEVFTALPESRCPLPALTNHPQRGLYKSELAEATTAGLLRGFPVAKL